MTYLEQLVDRANCLGIENDYLDINNVYHINSGIVSLDFNRYIQYEADLTDCEVFIPEGVTYVFIVWDEGLHILEGKDICFKFPSSMIYMGYEQSGKTTGIISLGFNKTRKIARDVFKEITFDFTICRKIDRIDDIAFKNMCFKGLYFPNSISYLGVYAFDAAYIKKLVLPNINIVGPSAFFNAQIDDLDIDGSNILECVHHSFEFGSVQEKLVLKNIEKLVSFVFKNVRNLYLPYANNMVMDKALEMLRRSEEVIKDSGDISKIYSELFKLGEKVKEFNTNTYYVLNSLLVTALLGDTDNERDKELVLKNLSNLFIEQKEFEHSVYMYQLYSDKHVEDRDYRLFGEIADLKVYVER